LKWFDVGVFGVLNDLQARLSQNAWTNREGRGSGGLLPEAEKEAEEEAEKEIESKKTVDVVQYVHPIKLN